MAELELRAWVTVDGVRGQVMGTRGDEYLIDTQDGYARWYPFSAIQQMTMETQAKEEATPMVAETPPEEAPEATPEPVDEPQPEPVEPAEAPAAE